jgi:hypothetical protein
MARQVRTLCTHAYPKAQQSHGFCSYSMNSYFSLRVREIINFILTRFACKINVCVFRQQFPIIYLPAFYYRPAIYTASREV